MSLLASLATPLQPGGMASFNHNDGFLEALLRGYKSGFLTDDEYGHLSRCHTMEDVKMNLNETDYASYFLDEPSPLTPHRLHDRCLDKLVEEFQYIKSQSVEPLSSFLDFVSYEYMIDNVMTLLKGTMQSTDININDLIEQCHPLGMFKESTMRAVGAFENSEQGYKELYQTVLVDTPVGTYFQQFLQEHEERCADDEVVRNLLNEVPLPVLENSVMKLYLQDFYSFCEDLGGETAEVMCQLLGARADSIAINIVANSITSPLNEVQAEDDRQALFPGVGTLYPFSTGSKAAGTLTKAHDDGDLRAALEPFPHYANVLREVDENPSKSIDDCFYARAVRLMEVSFLGQFHYGIFYSYVKLKEQEIRNLVWISECIIQDRKDKIDKYIPVFGRDLFNRAP
jgi:V-type H+-transporting ATPase subunit d